MSRQSCCLSRGESAVSPHLWSIRQQQQQQQAAERASSSKQALLLLLRDGLGSQPLLLTCSCRWRQALRHSLCSKSLFLWRGDPRTPKLMYTYRRADREMSRFISTPPHIDCARTIFMFVRLARVIDLLMYQVFISKMSCA